MKLKRLLALLVALAMTLTCCAALAEEAAPAEAAETAAAAEPAEAPEAMEGAEGEAAESEETQFFDSIILHEMEITAAEYMATPETRALSSVLMLLEMFAWNDPAAMEVLNTESLPTLYITASTSLGEDGLSFYYFYPELQKLVCATYISSTGQCAVLLLDAPDEPAVTMEGLIASGVLAAYEEISLTDFANAMNLINQKLGAE